MTVSSLSAAKALGEISNWSLSNLQMHKMLYLAHMFYLGRNSGSKLVDETFEAWVYGPVLPSLYQKAKIFGSDSVKDIFHSIKSIPKEKDEYSILNETYQSFANSTAAQLVAITHRIGGAWDKNYQPNTKNIKITDTDILQEYSEL